MAETGGLVANSREAPRLGAQHEERPLRPVLLVGLRLARRRLFQIAFAPIATAGCASLLEVWIDQAERRTWFPIRGRPLEQQSSPPHHLE